MQKSALNRQLTAGSDLNECAVYVCQPYACFKLAEVVEDMLRKSISRVNHGLTHIAPAPPLLVTYDRWSRSFHQKGQNNLLEAMVRHKVASDQSRPSRSGTDTPGLEAIGGREP